MAYRENLVVRWSGRVCVKGVELVAQPDHQGYARSGVLGGAGVAGPAALVLLEHRHRTAIADAAVDTGLTGFESRAS